MSKTKEIHKLAILFEEIGYTAVGDAIRKGNRAEINARFALRMYYRSLTSKRLNPVTKEVSSPNKEQIEKANTFYRNVENLINELLTNQK